MKAINEKNIAIIGGGPGGLTLARLLQIRGANVKVYERDANEQVRVQGATLDLHEESGLKALLEAGLMDAFNNNYRPGADKMRITDKHAVILFDDEENGADRSRPEIDRGPLRKILLDSLRAGTVVWDSNFKSMQKDGEGLMLEFQNGNTAHADVVIAADGANSKIRPFVTPIRAFFSGYTIVEGAVYNAEIAVPEMHQLLNGGKIFALGDEKTLIVSSKGDGSLVFYTGTKTDENWVNQSDINFSDKAQVIEWFKKEFAGWDKKWLTLFENASIPFVPRPQYCMPPDQHWEPQNNLTMLGDAAHVMPPYAGEGVNMAMLDALELADCLTDPENESTLNAIAKYEKNMLRRASEVATTTLEQSAVMHSVDGLKNMLSFFKG